MLPWALLRAYKLSGNAALKHTAKESLDFLASRTFAREGYYKPIGSHGWLLRGGSRLSTTSSQLKPAKCC